MNSFTHTERELRVRVGDDIVEDLADEVERLGATRALILATPGRTAFVEQARAALGEHCTGVFTGAVQHVPKTSVDAGRDALRDASADVIVSIGGGSPIGLAKALVLEADESLPIIAMPTTYSGSEATNIWGISDDGKKTTGRDARVAPKTILYVPCWTQDLPESLSMTSGVNAMAHCVEALYAEDATPMTTLMAADGIAKLGDALSRIRKVPDDLDARATALWGAFLAGRALDASTMGLHHKLAHVVGGSFNLPHSPTHSVLLPYSAAYNASAARVAMQQVAEMLGGDDGPRAIYDLNREIGNPESLAALGLREHDLKQVVDEVLEKEYPNPRPIDGEALLATLADAFDGVPPRTH